MTSCFLPWTMKSFQMGVCSYSKEFSPKRYFFSLTLVQQVSGGGGGGKKEKLGELLPLEVLPFIPIIKIIQEFEQNLLTFRQFAETQTMGGKHCRKYNLLSGSTLLCSPKIFTVLFTQLRIFQNQYRKRRHSVPCQLTCKERHGKFTTELIICESK